MKNRVFLILLIAGILLLGNSCGDSGTEPVWENENLIPLSIGNYWVFDTYLYNQNTHKMEYDETITFGIADTLTISGEKWYLLGENDSYFLKMINRNNGLYIYELWGDPYDKGHLSKYLYPIENGKVYLHDDHEVSVKGLKNKINTEAGEIECIRYFHENQLDIGTNGEFFNPDIGIVKLEDFHVNEYEGILDTFWRRSVLIDYNVK
jgi:hypothetical protein